MQRNRLKTGITSLILIMIVILSGCATKQVQMPKNVPGTPGVRKQSNAAFSGSEQVWSLVGLLQTTSDNQTKPTKYKYIPKKTNDERGFINVLTQDGVVGLGGKRVSYRQAVYGLPKANAAGSNTMRRSTLGEVNRELKAVHAGFAISSFSDMRYYQDYGNKSTLSDGYIIHNGLLYQIAVNTTAGSYNTVYVFSTKGIKAPTELPKLAEIQGEWSQDGFSPSFYIEGIYLYTGTSDDWRRVRLENLATTSVHRLAVSAAFRNKQTSLLRTGYGIVPARTLAGADNTISSHVANAEETYVVLSAKRIISHLIGETLTYQHLNTNTMRIANEANWVMRKADKIGYGDAVHVWATSKNHYKIDFVPDDRLLTAKDGKVPFGKVRRFKLVDGELELIK